MKKVMVAMSGGVDSSVAAHIIINSGCESAGVMIKMFDSGDLSGAHEKTCGTLDSLKDARAVADLLGIPFNVWNFEDEFKEKIMDKFVNSYLSGQTPNPCIDCNRYIKFGKLITKAVELGFDAVATGHYARIEYDKKNGRYLLKKAADISKDQSYVLYSLSQDQLRHTLFPLGGMTKTETREIAEENGFINANKRDSQDICFVPDGDYTAFIESKVGHAFPKGKFIDALGNELGEHQGIIRYTIGQRKGLGMTFGEPRFVLDKDAINNTVTLGGNEGLFSKTLIADDLNWISIETLRTPLRVSAKIRYNQKETPSLLSPLSDGTVKVEFDEAQRAISPGQAVVFYDGDIVVGGGTIVRKG